MADLSDIERLVPGEHGLATVGLARPDGTVHLSVVNAGVLPHPVGGHPTVAFVARGASAKVRHLRQDPNVTVLFRVGWEWAAAVGTADLIGPDDAHQGFEGSVPELLRSVFTAAGGTHDDWDEFDRVMAEERRTAVLVTPSRFLGR